MPGEAFQYAVLRVVPRVERGEQVNVGVVLFCRTCRFLGCRVRLDERRRQALLALAPDTDLAAIEEHLATFERIVAADPRGGPMAALPDPERFRWLVSPSSTIIQPGEVHSGLTEDPEATIERLFEAQVG